MPGIGKGRIALDRLFKGLPGLLPFLLAEEDVGADIVRFCVGGADGQGKFTLSECLGQVSLFQPGVRQLSMSEVILRGNP